MSVGSLQHAPLSWGLAIATYRRHDLLVRCVDCALGQTRPPSEVVICDSTPNEGAVASTKIAIQRSIERSGLPVRFVYLDAPRPQQTVQRNHAIDHSTADVLFMIDDDSLLYPTAAASIMDIYDRDHDQRVVGVNAKLASLPPDVPSLETTSALTPSRFDHIKRRKAIPRVMDSINSFWRWPYDPGFMHGPLPIDPVTASEVDFMLGATITVRRTLAKELRFDENLVLNVHEDGDMCLRLRRRGQLVEVEEPLIHHAVAPLADGLSRRGHRFGYAFVLDMAYLLRKNFGASRRVQAHFRYWYAKISLLELLASRMKKDHSRLTGIRAAKQDAWRVLRATDDELGPTLVECSRAYLASSA
ncbi:glycosyltransferase family 2 protein [Aeoliella sp. SH292]|uniref:glycosyltransferase family 2 protein n=1 Tax=Aeoliella sp. SH292 TaxID=3454464 RepID=UPI003F9893DF